jgi:uncharacterized heparinase superfamily protein
MLLGRLRDEARRQTKRPWSYAYPWLLRDADVLGTSSAASLPHLWDALARSGTFFLQPEDREAWTAALDRRFPAARTRVLAAADAAVRHEFDLLGSGPTALGERLPWHSDFKVGREWPLRYAADIEYLELDRASDVKVPWELSRFQHATALGQAFWLTGDDRYPREFVAQIDDWIARNPFAVGVNWACAMDVALRAVSWIWGFHFMAASAPCSDEAFRRRFLRALYMHGAFIVRNLEKGDVNGNHYLSDAVGLVFLGTFFRHTDDGARWRALGREIVVDEIDRQVSPDGVDFEASTPYHRLVLELFLTAYLLLERCGDTVPAPCWTRLAAMLDFVAAYTKPNGLAPLIGDADDGRVQKLGGQPLNDHRYLLSTGAVRFCRSDFKTTAAIFWEESFWLLGPAAAVAFDALPATPTVARSAAFPEGGVFVLRGDAAHLVVDCGEVGMRGRGGHGHNDILGFELFLNGRNFITDCGAFVYTPSPEWRNRFRATASHNTIQVDDEELNRFVGATALWQLADDARPIGTRFHVDAAGAWWRGAHTGYDRLENPVRPSRAIFVDRTRPIAALVDRVDGAGVHRLAWRFHLDPGCRVAEQTADGSIAIEHDGLISWFLPGLGAPARPRIDASWVSAAYGVKTETRVIVVETTASVPVEWGFVFASDPLDAPAQTAVLKALRVWAHRKE